MELIVLVIGFFIISILGTYLHFAYEFSKHNKLVAAFSAVNESTWEHLKIAVMPSILIGVVEYFFLYSNQNFIFGLVLSLITMVIVILILFYTYMFIFKKHNLIYDIITFYIAIALGELVFYLILKGPLISTYLNVVSLFGLLFIIVIFIVFTFSPPKNFLFIDPVSKETSLKAHEKSHNISKGKK